MIAALWGPNALTLAKHRRRAASVHQQYRTAQ